MATRLQLARSEIQAHLDAHSNRVLMHADLQRTLSTNRAEWRLPESTTTAQLITALSGPGRLQRVELKFPARKEIRYIWRHAPLPEILLTLRPHCHFSHFTAMQMHNLTEQDPRTIYVNYEQSPKPEPPGGLSQSGINRAFRGRPRTSKTVARYDGYQICLLNGKHTGYLGVQPRTVSWGPEEDNCLVRVTDVDRTLIDITVRPFYSGGPDEVLKAYQRAGERASATRLGVYLRKMRYVYPYHQAVGFYMDRAGTFARSAVDRFRESFPLDFDFHLGYGLQDTRYDEKWRLFVPAWM